MKKKWITFGLVVLVLAVADQLTKLWVLSSLRDTSGIVLIKGVFEFQYVENRGAAFGILQNQQWLFILITFLMGGLLVAFYAKLPNRKGAGLQKLCCMLIVAGAVGNLIDRIFRRFVVDFLYFSLIDFPVFNVADCYVCVGAVLLAFLLLLEEWKKEV